MRKTRRRANGTGKKSAARAYLCYTALAMAIGVCLPVHAAAAQTAAAEATVRFDIPAGDLAGALERFSTQSGIQLLYRNDLVAGKRTRAVAGSMTPGAALQRLLEGSGVQTERLDETTFVLKPGSPPPAALQMPSAPAATTQRNSEPEEVQELERLTVTGTRIRGGTSASPTIMIDEQQFQQEGFTDLGEVIRSIPQNFRGGQNPGVGPGASAGGNVNQDSTGGSALNLRGLGPDATLTLLNGRRLSYDGAYQSVDISTIPIAAVDRIEIMPDGASAIYGSDAVGGVANVVLKRDFDGVAFGTSYSDSSDGGLRRHEYNAIVGATWESGGLIATFKKSDQDPMFANQRSYTQTVDDPTAIHRETDLRSGLFSAHQMLGANAELRLDALRAVRTAEGYEASGTPGLHYSASRETTSTLVAPSLEMMLARDWLLTVGASRGKSEYQNEDFSITDGVSTRQGLSVQFNETQTWELGVEGPLAQLGQRDIRLAAGIGGRTVDHLTRRYIGATGDIGGDERSRYAYGELSVPLIDPYNARPGVHRLELSAAFRAEDYDSFGGVSTPKLGVIYDPSPDITLKASWGRSFKAPTLRQRYDSRFTYLFPAQLIGCAECAADATALMSGGGNPDLDPERASTWSATMAFHPQALPGLDTELTVFSIDYTQRIAGPIAVLVNALSDPIYDQFVQWTPTLEQQQQLLTMYGDIFYNFAGEDYDPNQVAAIVSSEDTNVSRQRARGVDFTGSYRFDLAPGQLILRGGASWIDLSQQNSAGEPEFDLSGIVYFPAEFNGRFGAIWSQGGFSLSAFANYTSGVTSELTVTPEKTASFTTFDATLRYETAPGTSPVSGVTLALSVDNLFNRTPPLHAVPQSRYLPYDSTNYSAIGRYMTASISKHW